MPLSGDEQNLLDFALGGLPGWFSDTEQRVLDVEGGMAKQMGAAWDVITYWFSQTLIGDAVGATGDDPDWLQQHAMDRDTRRANGELDEVLRPRLRKFPDALNRATLISIAQDMVDAAGVSGDVAMVELRRDRGYFGTWLAMSGTGGTFADLGGGLAGFTPDEGWGGRAPWLDYTQLSGEPFDFALTIDNAADSNNENPSQGIEFKISAVVGDRVTYPNAGVVPGADPTCTWRIERYVYGATDINDHILTAEVDASPPTGSPRCKSYYSRGYRFGDSYPTIILILPYGSDAALATAVAEAVRQRKAAGVRVYVERRQSP